MHGLIAFLIAALVIIVVAYVIIYVLRLIPGVPAPAVSLATMIVGLIAFLLIVAKALPLLGVSGVL